MRHPMDTFRSWRRRHHDKFTADFFFGMWRTLFELKERADSFWMPVDTVDRDERLSAIEKRLARALLHDWTPENVYSRYDGPPSRYWTSWRGPKEAAVVRENEAREFFKTLPHFGQFGYVL